MGVIPFVRITPDGGGRAQIPACLSRYRERFRRFSLLVLHLLAFEKDMAVKGSFCPVCFDAVVEGMPQYHRDEAVIHAKCYPEYLRRRELEIPGVVITPRDVPSAS